MMPTITDLRLLEEALAKALRSGSFQVIVDHGERYLEPIVPELAHLNIPIPRLNLHDVARDLERALS